MQDLTPTLDRAVRLGDLKTPALVLDRAKLEANTAAMTARMKEHGVALRPHMKTAKSIDVAHLALEGNFGGITVSTLREAAYFLEHGIRDITYAVGIVPAKLDEVAALERDGAELSILTDDVAIARAVAERGVRSGHRFRVLIEIDSGGHRAGVGPDGDALLAIARVLHEADSVEFRGVLTHAGHSYLCHGIEEIRAVAEDERAAAVRAAERLREVGIPCPTVSVGSTPTAVHAANLDGVTEARPGVYMFCDLFQAGIGVCGLGEVALGVMASVISHRAEHDRLLIDAGALALSLDRSTAGLAEDPGFGLVFDASARAPLGDLKVARVNQEHGFVEGGKVPFDDLPIGARVRVLPNHACMTAAMYDRYHVVDGGEDIIAVWPRCNGW